MHPCIQRIFLEFSNIEHSSVKHAATIFLAREFRFIIKEAKEIFAHYRVDAGCRGIVTADVLMKGLSRGAIATG